MCLIKIHKVNSSKYVCSLDLLTVIFDVWIFFTNTKGTERFHSWMNFHVFYQNPQGEISKVWMVFRFVDSGIRQLNLCHKQKRDRKVLSMKSINMFFLNLPGEIFKVWKVDSDIWQMNLYHLHKGEIGFTLEWMFMCFIRIH